MTTERDPVHIGTEQASKPSSQDAACDCCTKVNAHLAKFNTKIELPLWSASGYLVPFVQTIKIDAKKRGKPRLMAASYCPFCGVKYSQGNGTS